MLHTLGIVDLGAFVVAGLALNLVPGPDLLYASTQSVRHGPRAGWIASIGISSGCAVHVALGALGVTALLAAAPGALHALKLAGAAWLVWMGARMLTARPAGEPRADRSDADAMRGPTSTFAVWRDGFAVNALNPKVGLFFVAFVPQFIDPQAAHPALAFALLGTVFAVNGALVTGTLAALAGTGGRLLRGRVAGAGAPSHAARWLPRAVGAGFVALGLRLALDDTGSAPREALP